ncbi:MAG: hypothetical protein ACE5JO_08885 [Candidatus Binatia bacterium]
MGIVPLSKTEFDAYLPARNLNLPPIAEEVEWFADERRNVLGIVVRDRIDDDWLYVILGRDEQLRFRAISLDVSIESRDEARERLLAAMAELEVSGESVFPQGDRAPKKVDLFTPVVDIEKLDSGFNALRESKEYAPGRWIIQQIFGSLRDPDGNFVEQFQTTGFDSRLWELYLYTYLCESGFQIDRSHPAPDFVCTKFWMQVCIEAVTVNPTQGMETPSMAEPMRRSPEEIAEKMANFIPIKFGSPLVSKLQKRYWELDHVAGNPLIFAIADFHEPGSMVWSQSGLPTYLYGYRHAWSNEETGKLIVNPMPVATHKHGEKEIPSGFFFLPGAENISAVLFSNSGTISKFNRMGYILGHRPPDVRMIRAGTCYNHDPDAAVPLPFSYEVGDPEHLESWAEGLSMFHNPRAVNPVPPELFPDIAHHWLDEDGLIRSEIPDFHPFGSYTLILTKGEDGRGLED